ncbi:MAG: hypothetical protein O7H41_20760 [Planctomycetota bacterium]|nr:hypothetical protein [Planctomycetota bacterium]
MKSSCSYLVSALRPILILVLAILFACSDSSDKKPVSVPDAPTNLAATPASLEVTLSWNPVPAATSYNLYWSTSSGVTKATGTKVSDVMTGYLHTGLTNGITHYYVVTAVQGGGESVESTEASATPENAGILDTSFGGTGIVVHNGAAGGDSGDRGEAIVVDSMGRILVAGGSGTTSFELDMTIWRFNDDGTFDTSFNGQGWITHAGAAGGPGGDDVGIDLTLDGAGRIVVAGTSAFDVGNSDAVVWRYLDDGSLDMTFGAGGFVVHRDAAGGGGNDHARAVAIDSAGNILVTGFSDNGVNSDMVLARFLDDGSLDTGFAGSGVVISDGTGGASGNEVGRDVVIEPAGRILVVGTGVNSSGDTDLTIWAYEPTGVLDFTYGLGGFLVEDSAAGGMADDEGFEGVLDVSGNLLVGGYSWSPTSIDTTVWKVLSSGNLDTSFGVGGAFWHHNAAGGAGNDYGRGLALDLAGKINVVGYSYGGAATGQDAAIWRVTATGGLDTSFGGMGWVVHHDAAGGGGDDIILGTTIDLRGRIVATGWSINATPNLDMVVWRYR